MCLILFLQLSQDIAKSRKVSETCRFWQSLNLGKNALLPAKIPAKNTTSPCGKGHFSVKTLNIALRFH